MALGAEITQPLLEKYARKPGDTASPEVQIAVLTAKIENLSLHLRTFKQDKKSKRAMDKLVGTRKRFLRYLHRVDTKRFWDLIQSLGIRASF